MGIMEDSLNFVLNSTLAGMSASLILAWWVFHCASQRISGRRQGMISAMIAAALAGWFVGAFVLGISGFFKEMSFGYFPNIAYTFLPVIIGAAALRYSSFRAVVDNLSSRWLIGIQFYRILGIFFLTLYSQRLLPGEFALPAGVGDVLVGVAAPFVVYWYAAKKQSARAVALVWNVAGIGDLVLAVALGFMTSPGPFQLLAFDRPNELITSFPLVMVPAFGVPLSVLLHIYSLRVLLKKQR